jgi:SAM-dependent methyltransferase
VDAELGGPSRADGHPVETVAGRVSLRASAVARAKRLAGPGLTVRARCVLRGYGLPRWGNLRRTVPFSALYGFERGTPLDRYYLHRFLSAHADRITGAVLEVQTNSYTERFGRNVTRSDTFDIVPGFRPTYLCDIAHCTDVIPGGTYDCVLLPNTLPHFLELDLALAQIARVVRPGGTILASAAGLLPLAGDVPEYWRFSPDGWREKLASAWPCATLEVAGHGNCLAAVAAQMGLALEELSDAELDVHDPRYPVLTTICCSVPR